MRVMHIIPSAFNYFNDIRESAFGIISNLDAAGIDCEALTLGYSAPSRGIRVEVKKISGGGLHFEKTESIEKVINSFSRFDAVHLHCPFLGAAGKIAAWKLSHAGTPFLVTFYRKVILNDLFSMFIDLYNHYYLPRIFTLADHLTCINSGVLPKKWNRGKWRGRFINLLDKGSAVPLTASADKVQLKAPECEEIAARILLIYKKIINN